MFSIFSLSAPGLYICNPAFPSAEGIFLLLGGNISEGHRPWDSKPWLSTSQSKLVVGRPPDPAQSSLAPAHTSQLGVTFHLCLLLWLSTDLCWIGFFHQLQEAAGHQTTMWNASIAKKQGNLKEMCFLFQSETEKESDREKEGERKELRLRM